MANILINKDTIKANLQSYFSLAGFTNLNPGTPEHALWNIMTDNIYELYSKLNEAYKDSLPFTSTGEFLDQWANFLGNPRTQTTYTQDLSLTNVYFYIPDGVNRLDVSTSDITIPQGTRISVNGVSKVFLTTKEVIMTASPEMKQVFVPVRALEQGGFSNVNAEELNTHNLDTVPQVGSVIAQYINVSNKMPIQTGQFSQTDTELKESLQDVFGKKIGSNVTSIRDAIMDLPGVSNVAINSGSKGTGTFTAFIDSTAPVVSTSLLSQVQSLINQLQALGTRGFVKSPKYKAIQLKFEVVFKSELEDSNSALLTKLQDETREFIMNTINNLPRGASLTPSDLNRVILDSDLITNSRILELSIGDYSVMDENIHNKEMVVASTKTLNSDEKWFTNLSLIEYCIVNV